MSKAYYQHKFLSDPRVTSFYRSVCCPRGKKSLFKPHCFSHHIFTAYCVATLSCLLFWWVVSCGLSSNPLNSMELSTAEVLISPKGKRKKIKMQSCGKYGLQKERVCATWTHLWEKKTELQCRHRTHQICEATQKKKKNVLSMENVRSD